MMKPKQSNQKNLGLKIGTKEEAFWNEIKRKTKIELDNLGNMVKFNKAILLMCEGRIRLESTKLAGIEEAGQYRKEKAVWGNG